MPTVREMLQKSGLTDAQIDAIDANAMKGIEGVYTAAETAQSTAAAASAQAERDNKAAQEAREKAELERRSNVEFYETQIVPGLTGWEAEQKRLNADLANRQAEAAFYKTQNEALKASGLLPTDSPAYVPPVVPANGTRDGQGRFVAGVPGATPGSPTFVDADQIGARIGDVAGLMSDIQWKHQTLYGTPLPISPSLLIKQADALKLSPMEYASRTFKFAEKQTALDEQQKKDHDAQIAANAVAENRKAWDEEKAKMLADQAAKDRARAEGTGNNPEVRVAPGSSKFAEVRRATEEGARPDPLKMSDAERRAATRKQIHSEILDHAEGVPA